jgi:hypothetical protein
MYPACLFFLYVYYVLLLLASRLLLLLPLYALLLSEFCWLCGVLTAPAHASCLTAHPNEHPSTLHS